MRSRLFIALTILAALALCVWPPAMVRAEHAGVPAEHIFHSKHPAKPVDSVLKVAVGDPMPSFTLPTTSGDTVSLSDYLGRSNLVLSFVPAAWTPVCSDQWPGYNITREIFEGLHTALVGVSVDNTPTQYAWTKEMGGLWFPVASDFWPHGALADTLGILRSDGMAERALFLVDKQGVIRFIDVHDINSRPDLGELIRAMQALQ